MKHALLVFPDAATTKKFIADNRITRIEFISRQGSSIRSYFSDKLINIAELNYKARVVYIFFID